jgi:hypothetical protein
MRAHVNGSQRRPGQVHTAPEEDGANLHSLAFGGGVEAEAECAVPQRSTGDRLPASVSIDLK